MEDLTKTIMFTTNNLQGTPATIQYQTTSDQGLKQPKIEGQKSHEFPTTFCYNVNKIQMIAPTTQGHASTVNLAQLSDDKIQYITQPFAYAGNYAVLNQMQIAQNGITVDGRQLIVNKPIANTISNISFKCDVCGLMFSHLTLLNQHKRSHNTEENQTDTSQAIVVTQQPIIQTQNIISESGQNLGQIQIVATESLEPATQTVQHANNEITMVQTTTKDQKAKCITCNGPIASNMKRKGPKLIRCETCISGDNNVQSFRPTQIFVAPDGDIKFEIGEITQEQLGQNVIPITQVQTLPNNIQVQAVPQQKTPKKKNAQNAQPVATATAANNITTVVKCTKCNGTGVIVLNNPNATTSTSNNNTTSGTIVTSPGKTQIVQIQSQPQVQQQVQQIQIQQNHQQVQQQQQQQQQQTQQTQQATQQTAQQTMAPPQNPEKPFQCNVCGGRFSRYSSLWSHKKLHTGEKNYKCETCGIAFAKAVYLKNHQRIHTGEKPYRCNTCGMQFSQSPHLKNHERTHSGEKPYVCEVCDKGFARHATLWNHRRIHTGEKPYKCNRCQSAFSQAAHLKNHEKVHSGVKPFKCDICSAAFADRFALKRHRNIHEKYGQTAPLQSASSANNNSSQSESNDQVQVIKGEDGQDQEVEMMEEDDDQKMQEEDLKDFDPEDSEIIGDVVVECT